MSTGRRPGWWRARARAPSCSRTSARVPDLDLGPAAGAEAAVLHDPVRESDLATDEVLDPQPAASEVPDRVVADAGELDLHRLPRPACPASSARAVPVLG